jgi:hypothetical protein
MKKVRTAPVEALRKAHRALFKDLEKLEAATRAASATDARIWSRELDQARSPLAEHFRLEEEGGYMATVLQREPRLEHSVQHLLKEHQRLLSSLDALLQAAREAPHIDDRFLTQVRTWIDDVKAHETRENSLVEEAFNLDTSAED